MLASIFQSCFDSFASPVAAAVDFRPATIANTVCSWPIGRTGRRRCRHRGTLAKTAVLGRERLSWVRR